MSAEESRKVVSRAVMDEDFRKTLFSDPDKALTGYDLTPNEITALRSIPAETIDDFANNLDERISRSFLAMGLEAMDFEAMDSEAMDFEAMDSEAMDFEAMDSEAMDFEAMDAEALDADAMDAEALDAEAMDAEALDAEAMDAEALDAEALGAGVAGATGASWLDRLSAALGFGGGGGARGDDSTFY